MVGKLPFLEQKAIRFLFGHLPFLEQKAIRFLFLFGPLDLLAICVIMTVVREAPWTLQLIIIIITAVITVGAITAATRLSTELASYLWAFTP